MTSTAPSHNVAKTPCILKARFPRRHSAKSEPICIKSGSPWVHIRGLALADFGRNPRSSDSWRARRNFLSGKHRMISPFPDGQISRNLNKTRRLVSRWILLERNFGNFTVRGRFSKKTQNFWKFFNVLRLEAAITPQWLEIARNSLPK